MSAWCGFSIRLLKSRPAAPRSSSSGETGTGKELIAKAIHANSARSDQPFIPVNSGSLPSEMLESLLFGHVKGSFTGAIANRKGYFESANRGTIFFDEVGTVGPEIQVKLLRVLQDREFMPLGSNDTVRVDVRIIAATNVDLRKLVEEGKFREDLYYRLNVINLNSSRAARPQRRYTASRRLFLHPILSRKRKVSEQ